MALFRTSLRVNADFDGYPSLMGKLRARRGCLRCSAIGIGGKSQVVTGGIRRRLRVAGEVGGLFDFRPQDGGFDDDLVALGDGAAAAGSTQCPHSDGAATRASEVRVLD